MSLTPESARFDKPKPKPKRGRKSRAKVTASPEKIAEVKQKQAAAKPDRATQPARIRKANEEKKVAQAHVEQELLPVAKEINHRLASAEKNQSQADDHRLAAALRLAEAKKRIEAVGGKFHAWADKNVSSHGWESVRKLAAVGMSDNPAEALNIMRDNNKRLNKELRGRRDLPRSLRKSVKGVKPEDQPVVAGLAAVDRMPDQQRLKFLQAVAGNEGLKVIAAGADDSGKSNIVTGGLDGLKAAFELLPPPKKMEFVKYAAERVGAKLTVPSFGAWQ